MVKKIWRDIHLLKIIMLVFFISILTFILIFYFKTFGFSLPNKMYFVLLLICLIPIYFLIGMTKNKLSYITSEGIRIGNAYDDSYERIFLKQKPTFILWRQIKEIKIIGKTVPRPGYSWIINYLIIKTKNNQRHESFIAKPQEFIQTLKKLKKSYLLSKNSKYLDNK